mmetsp:Transcript_6188/g.17620  ORF Transcript_6188/g.17620 Transcript_6188/m.17620 type:complete len:597 (-) Transcript_6188:393-2183(-)
MLRHGQLRQCPRCLYGPVLNTHCGDLRAHDRSRGQGTDRTTNECPTCGFFSAHWSEWAIWDPEDFAAALRCPLCRDPCKLAAAEVPGLQDRLLDVDTRVSRADCLAWFSPRDFAALLFYLQTEAHPDCAEFGDIFQEFLDRSNEPDKAQELTVKLLQRPLLDLVQQRLSIEERIARKAMSDRAQRSASADDRQALAQRLLVDFETQDGFDGSACAAELQSVFPDAVAEVLSEIREAQEMSEGTMASALARLLAGDQPSPDRQDQEEAASEGDVLAAIHAVQKLQPSEKRFQSALARQDFLRAMHIAESVKPTLEAALRPVVAGSEAILAALRPLQWNGNGFAVLPDLDKVLRVLQSHVPWPYLSSSVANYVSLSGSSGSTADRGATPKRDFLTQDIFALARSALASQSADHAQSSCLGQEREELRDRQNHLELLLSTARQQLDNTMARRLSQLHRQEASRGPPKPCTHGQIVCEALLRHALCRNPSAHPEKNADVGSLFVTIHHMTMMAVQEAAPLDRTGGQSERLRSAMRDLQRRAFHLQGLARELIPLDRERVVDTGDASSKMLAYENEFQMLMREHIILVMHRILACAAALEK